MFNLQSNSPKWESGISLYSKLAYDVTIATQLRSIYTVPYPFLLLLEKKMPFSIRIFISPYPHNQTVTYRTKVFRKKFFVTGYSSIVKYRSYRSHTKFYLYKTVYFVQIWTYKNADEKAHNFSRSKNVKKKTDEKWILCIV